MMLTHEKKIVTVTTVTVTTVVTAPGPMITAQSRLGEVTARSRVGFLPEETYFFQDTRKKWKKPISSGFVRTKLEETGQNWKKLWKMSEMLEKFMIILNFLQKIMVTNAFG